MLFTAIKLAFGSFWMMGSLKAAIVDIFNAIKYREWAEDRAADEET